MNEVIEKLRKKGCDIDGAMSRFLGDEELYMSCFNDVLNDAAFGQLKEALEADNAQAAFDAAHTLKGVISQMGLTSLLKITVEIVEPLRNGKTRGMLRLYDKLICERDKYAALIG